MDIYSLNLGVTVNQVLPSQSPWLWDRQTHKHLQNEKAPRRVLHHDVIPPFNKGHHRGLNQSPNPAHSSLANVFVLKPWLSSPFHWRCHYTPLYATSQALISKLLSWVSSVFSLLLSTSHSCLTLTNKDWIYKDEQNRVIASGTLQSSGEEKY